MEDKIYTKVKNISGGNVVISTLTGFVITKDQQIDLSSSFKKSVLDDASGEIKALINAKLLEDLGDGADIRANIPATDGMITKEELEKKKREAKIRDIQGSSNVTALEDYAKDTDPEVVKVAKARLVELFGDDESESGSTVGIGLQ